MNANSISEEKAKKILKNFYRQFPAQRDDINNDDETYRVVYMIFDELIDKYWDTENLEALVDNYYKKRGL